MITCLVLRVLTGFAHTFHGFAMYNIIKYYIALALCVQKLKTENPKLHALLDGAESSIVAVIVVKGCIHYASSVASIGIHDAWHEVLPISILSLCISHIAKMVWKNMLQPNPKCLISCGPSGPMYTTVHVYVGVSSFTEAFALDSCRDSVHNVGIDVQFAWMRHNFLTILRIMLTWAYWGG